MSTDYRVGPRAGPATDADPAGDAELADIGFDMPAALAQARRQVRDDDVGRRGARARVLGGVDLPEDAPGRFLISRRTVKL